MKDKLVNKLLYVVIAIQLIAFAYISFWDVKAEQIKAFVDVKPARLSVASGPLRVYDNAIYIIKDSETEEQFIFVDGPDSTAVCPMRSHSNGSEDDDG